MFIKNLDKAAYKMAKMIAVREEKAIGEIVSESIKEYAKKKRKLGLNAIKPIDFGPGNERLSQEIDRVLNEVYEDEAARL